MKNTIKTEIKLGNPKETKYDYAGLRDQLKAILIGQLVLVDASQIPLTTIRSFVQREKLESIGVKFNKEQNQIQLFLRKITTDNLQQFIDVAKPVCWRCSRKRIDTPLTMDNFQTYDHDDGYEMEGYQQFQWIWFECPICQYGNSLRYLIHQWEIAKKR